MSDAPEGHRSSRLRDFDTLVRQSPDAVIVHEGALGSYVPILPPGDQVMTAGNTMSPRSSRRVEVYWRVFDDVVRLTVIAHRHDPEERRPGHYYRRADGAPPILELAGVVEVPWVAFDDLERVMGEFLRHRWLWREQDRLEPGPAKEGSWHTIPAG